MADADPFDVAAANGVGERIQRVADQSENVLDPDLLERADQDIRNRPGHRCLPFRATFGAVCAGRGAYKRRNRLSQEVRSGHAQPEKRHDAHGRPSGDYAGALVLSGRRGTKAVPMSSCTVSPF